MNGDYEEAYQNGYQTNGNGYQQQNTLKPTYQPNGNNSRQQPQPQQRYKPSDVPVRNPQAQNLRSNNIQNSNYPPFDENAQNGGLISS